jgi:hypothetical protein
MNEILFPDFLYQPPCAKWLKGQHDWLMDWMVDLRRINIVKVIGAKQQSSFHSVVF